MSQCLNLQVFLMGAVCNASTDVANVVYVVCGVPQCGPTATGQLQHCRNLWKTACAQTYGTIRLYSKCSTNRVGLGRAPRRWVVAGPALALAVTWASAEEAPVTSPPASTRHMVCGVHRPWLVAVVGGVAFGPYWATLESRRLLPSLPCPAINLHLNSARQPPSPLYSARRRGVCIGR